MAKNKTTETHASVAGFLTKIKDKQKRSDSSAIVDLISRQTGLEPKMWGSAIVGFGSYHYKYASGHEGDAPIAGFSPRKDAIVLYVNPVFPKRGELLKKLGKHKAGKSCIYIKKLEDVDEAVMERIIVASIEQAKKDYPG